MYGREQVSRALVTRESMEEDDMVMRVGSSLVLRERERRTDEEGRAAGQNNPYSLILVGV